MKRITIASILVSALGILQAVAFASNVTTTQSTIIETMVQKGQFQKLSTALAHTPFLLMLQNDGPYTLLAPTDDAFAGLPEGAFDAILEDERKLRDLLGVHIIRGSLAADDIRTSGVVNTLLGTAIDIRLQEGKLRIENACLIAGDIVANNGFIHIIDQLILPGSKEHGP